MKFLDAIIRKDKYGARKRVAMFAHSRFSRRARTHIIFVPQEPASSDLELKSVANDDTNHRRRFLINGRV